ncbi:hypothetical protein [Mycoplasmopsis gallinarum]|uniref:Uncharacterized protein n=1 Tax=Mycoplasmopsis gallinarum TaxID=29557 RepID=A0A168RMA5_9BACT|nr:hypothetical protein [Mycoplasmopsis gallinarum]OAB49116.1 hypothetical protein MGALLINA_01640 [Mycoplasmopsis gallinarum]
MLNKFLGLIVTLNNTVQIATSIVPNTQNEKKVEANNASESINQSIIKNLELFKNINIDTTNQLKIRQSVNKVSDEEIINILIQNVRSLPISYEQQNKILDKLNTEKGRNKLINLFRKEFKNNLIENAKQIKEERNKLVQSTNIPRQNTEKDYFINLDSLNTSKVIYNELQSALLQIKNLKDSIDPIQKKIRELNVNISILNSISIAASAASVTTTILAFCFPMFAVPLAFASFGIGAASFALDLALVALNGTKQTLLENLNKIKKITLNENEYKNGVLISAITTLFGIKSTIASLVDVGVKATGALNAISKMAGSVSIASSLVSGGLSIKSLIDNVNEIIEIDQKQKQLINKTNEIVNKINQIKNKITYVVIHETELTDKYENGGIGGKNLVFKNVVTNENFTIEQMLQKTDFELYLANLQKVFNPRLNEWYIRSIKNNNEFDNLG